MSAIGLARRCCRDCGKERGPGRRRRRRRRQQPCLSSCSSCCCPDSASPAASVSLPLPRPGLWALQPWTEQSCSLDGEVRGAPASADSPAAWARSLQGLRRRLGAGCSAIVTAALERARKGGVTFLCSVRDPPRTLQPPPFWRSGRWTPPSAGDGEDDFCLRFRNFYCQRDFNFSSAQLSTSLQCRKKGRAVCMWQDLPSSGKMEFAEARRGHFSIVSWGTFSAHGSAAERHRGH